MFLFSLPCLRTLLTTQTTKMSCSMLCNFNNLCLRFAKKTHTHLIIYERKSRKNGNNDLKRSLQLCSPTDSIYFPRKSHQTMDNTTVFLCYYCCFICTIWIWNTCNSNINSKCEERKVYSIIVHS